MRLMRTAAMAGVAKKLYDEARKPHNQAKIRNAVEQMKSRRSGGTGTGGTGTSTPPKR